MRLGSGDRWPVERLQRVVDVGRPDPDRVLNLRHPLPLRRPLGGGIGVGYPGVGVVQESAFDAVGDADRRHHFAGRMAQAVLAELSKPDNENRIAQYTIDRTIFAMQRYMGAIIR